MLTEYLYWVLKGSHEDGLVLSISTTKTKNQYRWSYNAVLVLMMHLLAHGYIKWVSDLGCSFLLLITKLFNRSAPDANQFIYSSSGQVGGTG